MKNRIDPSLKNLHEIVIGASGSGKSTYIKGLQAVRDARRFVVWDPDGEYRVPHVGSPRELLAVLRKAGFGPVRVGLHMSPSPEAFGQFCALVLAVSHAAAPLLCLVEELADVTSPAKAAQAWGELIRRGRKYGVRLVAASQRPQEIDKTVFSQCAARWCGRLETDADRRYMSRTLDVKPEELAALQPLEFFRKVGPEPAQKGRVKLPRRSSASVAA